MRFSYLKRSLHLSISYWMLHAAGIIRASPIPVKEKFGVFYTNFSELLSSMSERNLDIEGTSLPKLAVQPHISAMALDDRLDDGQT